MAKKKRTARNARAGAARSSVLVVNMIPRALSGETEQDSEPMIAVDPTNPQHIVGTAFTPDPMGGNQAPIYVSTDGGITWTLRTVVPGGRMTGDITVAFSGTAGKVYAGILRNDSPTLGITRMSILRTTNFAAVTPMTVLEDRLQPDQPFAQAATVPAGAAAAGKERVYVGSNDFAAGSRSATLDVLLDAGATTPAVQKVRIEKRSTATAGQDGPQIRPVVHRDGTVYAVFYGWRSTTGSFSANTLKVTSDVVVVRDDSWGTSNPAFEALKDPADNLAGIRVVQGVKFGFDRQGKSANGQQRLGGTLSLAVDPRAAQSSTVYLAWGDEQTATGFTIHVRRSTNRGAAWSATDLLTLTRSTNAALAINSDGVVGLLYQQLTGTASQRRWVTHFRRTSDGTTWSDLILADTPANLPAKSFDPYLGDYDHLVAVGKDFYGIFSANNTPDLAHFPNGVQYQRNHDFTTRKLRNLAGTATIAVSIDPFFFKVTG